MTEKESKPNCYECRHRGTIPGDAHSRCKYPGVKSDLFDFFANANENQTIGAKLNIKANFQGVRGGWFAWPVNFDPVWLESCDGFKAKEINSLPQEATDDTK